MFDILPALAPDRKLAPAEPRMRCGACDHPLVPYVPGEAAQYCTRCGFHCPRCATLLVVRTLFSTPRWHCPYCRSLQQFVVAPKVQDA